MKKGNSIVGGLILLLIGVGLLWWNEGNNVRNLQSVSEGMKNYTDIKSSKIDSKYDGKLVATSGKISVTGTLTDDEFNVSSDKAALLRKVEMYQWTEDCDSDNNCTYEKEWSDKLIDSSEFTNSGHENPDSFLYESEKYISDDVKLGTFTLPDKLVSKLSTDKKIKDLSEEVATNHSMTLTNNNYYTNVVDGKAEIGNIRISFYENNTKVASVLAMQTDDTFKIYKTKKGKDLFRIYEDNYNGYDMLMMITKQNNFSKWLFRIIGILFTMGAISSLFSPLTSLMEKIPVLGSIVNGATSTISFVIGLAISLIVIAIAWLRFRPIVSIIILLVVIALIVLLKFYSQKKPEIKDKSIDKEEDKK